MSDAENAKPDFPQEIEQLRARLEEAEQTIEAIRSGQVDALVVSGPKGDRIFTLTGADHIYRVIVETMNEAALTVDFDGTILFCNHQFAKLMRMPMEEVWGHPVTQFVADPQRPVLETVLKQAQSAPVKRRLVFKAQDGAVIHVQLAASLLQLDGENSLCLIVNDLTELEASARSIAVLRKQHQELEQSKQALRRAIDDLARSNRELEQFAYVASHDLQEPLRQITSFVDLLQKQPPNQLDAKSAQYLEFVREGSIRMRALVQDLLAYSRVGGDKRQYDPVSCQAALTMAMTALRKSIEETHAKITYDELPMVSADPIQLAQLFQNLLGNAIKFRRKGATPEIHIGVKKGSGFRGQGSGVRGQGTESKIRETMSSADKEIVQQAVMHPFLPEPRTPNPEPWLFFVRDNGIGIEPQYHDKIFAIFQRLHTREEYPGTGIGLAICKKIVERLGGRIWIESKLGEGSTFYFTLSER